MTIVDEILEALSLIASAAPAKAISGRLVDQIGVAVSGATIRVLATGVFSGRELARAITNERGAFVIEGTACTSDFVLAIETAGVIRHRVEHRRPPLALGDVPVILPLRLSGAVGDAADNRPYDVARVQDRLRRLGRLSDADVIAEPIALGAAPVAPGPRLMAAIAAHLVAGFGRALPVTRIGRTDPALEALLIDPPFPITQLALAAPVGELPGRDAGAPLNLPPSVGLVQERLHQMGLITAATRQAELADVTAAGIDPGSIPETLAAIAAFDRRVTGGSLRAIVPAAANAAALNDPCVAGRRPLQLRGSVGTGGLNRPDDVRRVQDRLLSLGYLSAAQRAAERPPVGGDGTDASAVPDATLAQTIAAITALRQDRLGEPAPAVGRVDREHETVARLNRPLRLELTDTVGWGPSIAAANRPADVRRLQDRLLLIGLLSQANYNAERADPAASARIDQSLVQQTSVALALASAQRGPLPLTGSVGEGGANDPDDVRAVQDRLNGLGFLADADYQRERAGPIADAVVDASALTSTFAAITQARTRIFELPAPSASAPWTAHPIVEPGDETHLWLSDPLFSGRHPLALDGSVGTFGWNFPADVRAVQERLRLMRLLGAADFRAEAVDAARAGRVTDLQLAATREAIRRLRESLLAEPSPAVERVEARSAAIDALEDSLGAVRSALTLGFSVGWSGENRTADVTAVQRRLHQLGFLADADFALESQATPAAGEQRLRDYQIPETIAAIDLYQRLMLGTIEEPRVEPLSELRATLEWPAMPRRMPLPMSASVGRGAVNAREDVRLVQDRLFELGLLAPRRYFGERVDGAGGGTVADAALPETIAAIGRLQETLGGLAAQPPNFLVEPGSRSARVLADPAWSTPTAPNPNCALASAGPARPLFNDVNLMRVIVAIETEEGGVSSGEIPAILRNASGTPTSWGAAQVIGATAVAMLSVAANNAFAVFYGLDAPALARLRAIRDATVVLFDAITPAVAVNTTEAALLAQAAAYAAANGDAVRTDTGLGAGDVERMFRAAQFLRHVTALGVNGNEATLLNAAAMPHAAANIAALDLTLAEVGIYLRNPPFYGEHRQGFVTRALLCSPEGQVLRNALTDDSGFKIGRYVIRDNWNATAAALPARDRAQLTAYLHNHGGDPAALANQLAVVAADAYVVRVMNHYDNP